ncbi:hypothetical protein AXG93_1847s1290 [Marchantia polymorpha subsp. ruderalis]|uniref:Uncharacterized protein n=1 Tax=Marchantia polymorpha subsp. ruderalis TaxID=1480154 RepID=A0A176VFD8_MARPO|nr:hypothetical protein AXG93_1847s1290 [Marchantia polymorpha subsp. ruderalis]
MSSSGDGKTPCPHDHQHDFKKEIEESIRRCEQLLSIDPPILYHATCLEGKNSTGSRRSSRSSGKTGSGISRAEPSAISSGDYDESSGEIDPEWRKNMGLLINLQDGNVTTVTPIAADEEVVIGTPVDEEGNPPDERVETEYNFSFDESKGSSRSGTVPQSISITTRTVTRESRSDITSESEDWNYDAVGPTRSPSSSASGMGSKSSSRSKIPSHSSSKSKPRSPASYKSKSPGSSPSSRTKSSNTLSKSKSGSGSASVTGSELSGLLPPDDPRDLDVESDRYSEAASGSVTRSERELARARQSRERERSNLELLSRASGGEFDETVSRREEGDYEVVTTERCATFPRHRGSPSPPSSPHSSISIRKGMSPPKTPRSRSPKSPRAEPEPNRILLDTLSFSFNTPQPYTDNWEWVGECSGLKADRHRFEGAHEGREAALACRGIKGALQHMLFESVLGPGLDRKERPPLLQNVGTRNDTPGGCAPRGHADFAAIRQVSKDHPNGRTSHRIDVLQFGDVNGGFHGDNSSRILASSFDVLLDQIFPLDVHLVLRPQNLLHLPGAVVEENLDMVNGRPPNRPMQGGDGMQKRFKVHGRTRVVKGTMSDSRKSPGAMRGGRVGGGGQLGANAIAYPSGKASGSTARLRHLSKPRTDLYQKLAHTRAQLEEEHMSECSFKPRVGRRPDPQSQYSAPLIHRVTGIEKRVDLRKRARKVIEKEELDQCSFWPQINSNPEYLDLNQYKPIEERSLEYQRRREAKIAMARAMEDQQKGLTFRPEINPNSIKIFKQTGLETINVADRLTAMGSLHNDNKNAAARTLPKDECTFTPEINSNTDLIIRSSKLLEGCTPDFFSRQQYWLQRLEMRKKAKEQEMQNELSFKPNIDSNSDAILKTSPIREILDQPLEQRVDRLYQRDTERRKHIRRKISEAYYAQFTHSPSIDHTSRLLGGSSTAYELFKEKARVLEEMKVIRELQEFKECTFKPQVNRAPPKDQEPVMVKGLGRFLELQDLAKQMKKDQEEWERKIFYQHVYALPKRQYTIPKPFSFAHRLTKSYSARQQKEERRTGCTVRFLFHNKVKERSEFVDFYEASHPTPKNPKWKDVTRWLKPEDDPRFNPADVQNDLSFSA